MQTRFFAIAALVGASAFSVNAQTPQQPPEQQRPTQQQQPRTGDTTQREQQATNQTVTVTGCLKAEKDVPGRRPNVAERAGVTEDYILTSVKMSPASQTSGIGLAQMLEIEGIAESELQKHLNHQVEVTGRLSQGNMQGNRGASATGSTGATGTPATQREGTQRQDNQASANADLPQIQATSIKMVAATCPAQ
jgi:hypothetical protein